MDAILSNREPCPDGHPSWKNGYGMTEEHTEFLLDLWSRLTDALDFHAKKWHEQFEDGDWREVSFQRAQEVMREVGVEDEDLAKITQQFAYRDQEAHARAHEDERRAQLRFGF